MRATGHKVRVVLPFFTATSDVVFYFAKSIKFKESKSFLLRKRELLRQSMYLSQAELFPVWEKESRQRLSDVCSRQEDSRLRLKSLTRT